MGHAQRRQHGDGLRGRERGFYRLGNHFTAVYWRYHEYGHQYVQLFLPSLLELGCTIVHSSPHHHQGGPSSVDASFSPDNQFILSGHEDGSVCFYQADTGALVTSWGLLFSSSSSSRGVLLLPPSGARGLQWHAGLPGRCWSPPRATQTSRCGFPTCKSPHCERGNPSNLTGRALSLMPSGE